METFNILSGISKNLCANPSSLLSHLHIISISINSYGWKTLGKGIGESLSLSTLIINLCEVDREALKNLSDGMKTNGSI